MFTKYEKFINFLSTLSPKFKNNKTSFGLVIQMLEDISTNQTCINYYKNTDTKILMQQHYKNSDYKKLLNELETDFFKLLKKEDILISNYKEAIIVTTNFKNV